MITALLILVGLCLLGILGLNSNYIPTPQDELLRMEAAGTTAAASTNGATKNLGKGFSPGGVGQPSVVVLDVTALDRTSGDETYIAVMQESADGVTWTDAGAAVAVTAAGVLSVPGFVSRENVRCKLTLGGTTPSITYGAWFNPLSD